MAGVSTELQCSVTCGAGDWGYSASAFVSGRDFDSAYIDGIGWIDPPGGVYTPRLPCVNGTVSARLAVYDSTGNQSATYGLGNWVAIPATDTSPPVTTATPAGGLYNAAQTVTLSVNRAATTYYSIDGSIPTNSSNLYQGPIAVPATTTLKYFSVSVNAPVVSEAVKSAAYTIDTILPTLTVSTLADGSYTNNNALNVAGTATDNLAVQSVTVSGITVTVNANNSFSKAVTLVSGPNTITTIAVDTAGNRTTDVRTITFDQSAPIVSIGTPADNSVTNAAGPTVTGTVNKPASVTATMNNGTPVSATMTGNSFSLPVTLIYGQNTIEVTATDLAGNTGTSKRTVTLDNVNPVLAVTSPAQDISINQSNIALHGTVADITGTTVTVDLDGITSTPTVTAGTFQQQLTFTTQKTYAVMVTATDAAGNHTTVQRNIIYDTTPPGAAINPVTTPTTQQSQTIGGTRDAGSTVVAVCATAAVSVASYPTATAWTIDLSNMQAGDNAVTIIATDPAGNQATLQVTITVNLPLGAVNCSDWTDYGGSQYGTQCSVTCGPGDWGYSVDASVSGRDFDTASIDGIGWIDPPGGVYTPSLPCVNGTVSFRLAVYDSTGNQSASYSAGNWVEILNPGAHIVTAAAGTGGSITPGSIAINSGGTATFTLTPNPGYAISSVTGCGGVLSGNTYVTGPVTAACTVNAVFASGPIITCSDWTDYGGSQYGTECSITCGAGDWGYSASAFVSGRDFDSAYIDGIGWIDPPGGVYTPRLPCVNGTVSARLAVYDSTGNQSATYGLGNWVAISQ